MKPAQFHPLAQADQFESARFYDGRQTGLGDRFLAAVENALIAIRRSPHRGLPSEHATRLLRVKKFPFGVVYKEYDDHILVVAVAHFSRKPGFWHDRL